MPFLRFNHSQTANKQVELPIAPSALPAAVLVRQKVDIGVQDDGGMLALSDSQLRSVWAAAARVPVEKRGVFLERVVARLQLHRSFTDADLDDAVRLALTGLIQSAA